jgi:hypothetical protein
MREHLQTLARLLHESGDDTFAASIEDAASAPDPRLQSFLASNELWGGSGSIADSAGGPERSDARREIERVLIQIGTEQMRSGNVNPRTEMWLKAFTAWEKARI